MRPQTLQGRSGDEESQGTPPADQARARHCGRSRRSEGGQVSRARWLDVLSAASAGGTIATSLGTADAHPAWQNTQSGSPSGRP